MVAHGLIDMMVLDQIHLIVVIDLVPTGELLP